MSSLTPHDVEPRKQRNPVAQAFANGLARHGEAVVMDRVAKRDFVLIRPDLANTAPMRRGDRDSGSRGGFPMFRHWFSRSPSHHFPRDKATPRNLRARIISSATLSSAVCNARLLPPSAWRSK